LLVRSHGRWKDTVFAVILIAIFWVGSLPAYIALVLASAVLGGMVIGRRSAVYVTLGTLGMLAVFDAWAVEYLFRVRPHTQPHPFRAGAILLALAGGAAAAVGVRLRRS
jgi:hypothetical protein